MPTTTVATSNFDIDEPSSAAVDADDSVTVLIAAYNAGAFLHRAIRSAQNQTKPPLEILVVDDGSLDDTAEVAKRLGLEDPRIRLVVLNENGGPAKARNAGIEAARGTWIAILDADDAFLPERLERLTRIGSAHRADVVLDNFAWYDAKHATVGSPGIPSSSAIEAVDIYKFVRHAAKPIAEEADWGLLQPMFRRKFLHDNNLRYPSNSRHGEDFLLMIEVFLSHARCVLSRCTGYLYTTKFSGMSRTMVDYDTMATQTFNLLLNDRIRPDRLLKRLLKERIRKIKRLSATHKLNFLLARRAYASIALSAPTDLWFQQAVLRFALSKARRWMSRYWIAA